MRAIGDLMGGTGVGGRERQGARNADLFHPPLSTVSSSKRSEHTLPSIVNENTLHTTYSSS